MQNHPIPKDAIVIEMVNRLGADDHEAFEERAAIIEYDGQVPRAHAECLAAPTPNASPCWRYCVVVMHRQ